MSMHHYIGKIVELKWTNLFEKQNKAETLGNN